MVLDKQLLKTTAQSCDRIKTDKPVSVGLVIGFRTQRVPTHSLGTEPLKGNGDKGYIDRFI